MTKQDFIEGTITEKLLLKINAFKLIETNWVIFREAKDNTETIQDKSTDDTKNKCNTEEV